MPTVLRTAFVLFCALFTPIAALAQQMGGAPPARSQHQGLAAVLCVLVLAMAVVLWTAATRRRARMGGM